MPALVAPRPEPSTLSSGKGPGPLMRVYATMAFTRLTTSMMIIGVRVSPAPVRLALPA